MSSTPLIVHIIHRLNVGGLENGLVNLLNNLPKDKYRHAIIALTESSEFSKRITRNDIDIYELHKKEGKDFGLYVRLYKLLKKIRPHITHSRNLSTLEASIISAFAGVPIRIHGEHGRDIYDLHGKNKRYQKLRKFSSPFIHRFVALSRDLESWLIDEVGIAQNKVVQLYNGVDTDRFRPGNRESRFGTTLPETLAGEDVVVLGTVGRLEPVKDQPTLVQAFIQLIGQYPELRQRLRLIILGDGSLMQQISTQLKQANVQDLVWLPGNCENVADILRDLDIFVLPSLGEGISNTILEAMASGLPVVATDVGGNSELLDAGVTGTLVPAGSPTALAEALLPYINDEKFRQTQGQYGRQRVEREFSLHTMMERYQSIYDAMINEKNII